MIPLLRLLIILTFLNSIILIRITLHLHSLTITSPLSTTSLIVIYTKTSCM
jgi:hypothetical protein